MIRHRFGLGGASTATLREVAALMGVSRERVRQIEQAATERMRRIMARRQRPTQLPFTRGATA